MMEPRVEALFDLGVADVEAFWTLMVKKLYFEVFQKLSLPRSLIMQSFIHKSLYPSSLKEVLDKLLVQGVLAEREAPKVEKEQSCSCLGLFSKKKDMIERDTDLVHRDYLESVV